MRKLFLLGAFLLSIAACANYPTYGETLQPWVGQSEERLIQSWGIPHDVFYVTPNEKVMTYLEVSSKPLNNDPEPYSGSEVNYPAIATPDFGFPNQPQYTNYYCKTTFTIQNGVVVNYGFNGDDCVAVLHPQ